jgi:sugar phosphate isomerase/epimerase
MEKAEDEDNHDVWINQRREFCEKIGLKVNQAHAPFCEGRPVFDNFADRVVQCVDDCAILGAKCLVVHGDTWFKKDYIQWDYGEVVNTVYEVYAPVVDRAEKLGVKIAFETLFEWIGNDDHRVRLCSKIEEIDDLASKFSSNAVGVCWDFGHAFMAYGADQFAAMKRLKTPIIATHVHDNTRRHDNHNIPYQGYINWEEGLKTLADKGYRGDLTFEMNYGALPPELILDYGKYLCSVGKYMASQFEFYSAK